MSRQTAKPELDYHPKGALVLVLVSTAWTAYVATGETLWLLYGAGVGLLCWGGWVGGQVVVNAIRGTR